MPRLFLALADIKLIIVNIKFQPLFLPLSLYYCGSAVALNAQNTATVHGVAPGCIAVALVVVTVAGDVSITACAFALLTAHRFLLLLLFYSTSM